MNQTPVGWAKNKDHNTIQEHKCGPPRIYNQQNVRKQERTQTKDTHPVPKWRLKYLNVQGIEPRTTVCKVKTLLITPRRRKICHFLSFFFPSFLVIYPTPMYNIIPGTYSPNIHGSDAFRENNRLWPRTLEKYVHKGGPPWICVQQNGETYIMLSYCTVRVT